MSPVCSAFLREITANWRDCFALRGAAETCAPRASRDCTLSDVHGDGRAQRPVDLAISSVDRMWLPRGEYAFDENHDPIRR